MCVCVCIVKPLYVIVVNLFSFLWVYSVRNSLFTNTQNENPMKKSKVDSRMLDQVVLSLRSWSSDLACALLKQSH